MTTDTTSLPEELVTNPRIALSLSGGGFRASLFHLGVTRRLFELGILQRVATISSVSGGSIFAGFLAHVMHANGFQSLEDIQDWIREVEEPFRAFTARDLRTWPVLAHLAWNWALPQPRANHMLARYRKRLTDMPLTELPENPAFVFCATDLSFGVNYTFRKDEVGDYQAGYAATPAHLTVAHAVAASASFPPVFGPMAIPVSAEAYRRGNYDGPDRDKILADLRLSDGGVYDNMGLEPVWRNHDIAIVSDCGAPFGFEASKVPLVRYLRYPSVIMNQVSSLRIRWLMSLIDDDRRLQFKIRNLRRGVYLPLTGSVNDGLSGYSSQLVNDHIATIRTDLDNFSHAEQSVLINHGYTLTDARIQKRLPWLIAPDSPPPTMSDSALMDGSAAEEALVSSHRRVSARRLLASVFKRMAKGY